MKYFGTDGIRGEANVTLTVDTAFKLGKALKHLNCDTLVIGTDTRLSKDMMADAVAAGAMSMGINVIKAGVVPTPCLIYYTQVKHIIGVMITASHNPYYDNGLKVVFDGEKLLPELELLIEESIDNDIFEYPSKMGKVIEVSDIMSTYEELLSRVLTPLNKKICIDTANGATYKTAVNAFSKVTSSLKVIANNPDGININNGVGSTHLGLLQSTVKSEGFDLGFAFDGDGDRVLAIDEDGNVVDGDKLIYIIAKYLRKQGKLNDNKVVYTKMSNLGIIKDLKENGIECLLTDVGDKYVVRALKEYNLSVGGENSGHIIVPGILSTGDGVLVALLITKILSEENKTLKELTSSIYMYPDVMKNMKVKDKSIINRDFIQNRVKEITESFGEDGKIILRASGTENLIRLTVSCKDKELVDKYIEELSSMILSEE